MSDSGNSGIRIVGTFRPVGGTQLADAAEKQTTVSRPSVSAGDSVIDGRPPAPDIAASADEAAEDETTSPAPRPDADYQIGYSKPPKEHQFAKNTSGNPRGRPKGSVSLKTELKLIIGQPVAVTENGKKSKRSTLAVVLMKLRADALAGKPKAVDQLIKLIIGQLPDEITHDHRATAAEDAELLAKLKDRMK